MDLTRPTTATVVLALAVGSLALTSRVAAAPQDLFVVDTQFYAGQSTVVEATGRFAGCVRVRDLGGTVTEAGATRFTGEKRLACAAGAKVFLEYDVVFDPGSGATTGSWHVTASTLDGVEPGDGGALLGDPGGCSTARRACGCILDTFTLAT